MKQFSYNYCNLFLIRKNKNIFLSVRGEQQSTVENNCTNIRIASFLKKKHKFQIAGDGRSEISQGITHDHRSIVEVT